MTKSYAQLMKQISKLQSEAEGIRRKETQGVIARIKEAIQAYNLTATDLGLSVPRAGGKSRAGASAKRIKSRKSRTNAPIKYRDDAGNTWVGRGKRPDWLRNALASGRQLEDFLIR